MTFVAFDVLAFDGPVIDQPYCRRRALLDRIALHGPAWCTGVTGWAQVHGLRGQTSLAERVEWDNYYIANWSLGLDLKILVMTVIALLRAAE